MDLTHILAIGLILPMESTTKYFFVFGVIFFIVMHPFSEKISYTLKKIIHFFILFKSCFSFEKIESKVMVLWSNHGWEKVKVLGIKISVWVLVKVMKTTEAENTKFLKAFVGVNWKDTPPTALLICNILCYIKFINKYHSIILF